MFRKNTSYFVTVCLLFCAAPASTEEPPGVVINYIPSSSGIYIGSPGIAVCPDGSYIAKHDEFGPKSTEHSKAVTRVFRSTNRGETWKRLSAVKGLFWASVFAHRTDLYLIGTDKQNGLAVIMQSKDGGKTWTTPKDKRSGLLFDTGKYHCAPVPVIEHRGRIWRAMEDAMGPDGWGTHFHAFMMSAPADANLLDADNWTFSNRIGRDPAWLGGKFSGWLEGNAVVTPSAGIVNILRVHYLPDGGKAAVINVSEDGTRAIFDADTGFIDFPGGSKKFTIRYDPVSARYWTLANPVLPRHKDPNPSLVRNAVGLMCSADLRNWTIRSIVLYHPDVSRHGFQYVDWLFDGDDIIAASRTAFGTGERAAPRQHDANYLTFHRIEDFRELTMADSAEGARPGQQAWTAPKTTSR
ncbi:MAG: hypothetical protein JSU70_22295 [Phycisphaerales bacterium]|nr:MAG: hypothetical protein JSU70_22295 [Phycisphaerales bacterium]